MKKRIAFVLATWFGCGRVPIAPGTVGTFGALPLYFLVREGGTAAVLATAAVLTAVGVWAAGVVAESTETKDPQIVVIDEVAGVMIALAAARSTLGIVLAVGLFRLFDVTKPFPARRAERLPGGWGIILDDIAAGVYAAAVVAVVP
ncbi:MAG: phosphatidylglycerophosphatase A [Labilithrix sp.]|nr:phosphatidylglycerophosphatase A [Labilithrix sp.]MCW5812375.1 phosphatidylglycerophosphatase A [Labilithrix sp.]